MATMSLLCRMLCHMTPRALLSVIVAVPLLGVSCADYDNHENTCLLGGALQVFSTPAHLPVTNIHCNVFYEKDEFQQRPIVKYLAARPGEKYTVFMLDPDAPDRTHPRGVYLLHWILANIPGEDLLSGIMSNSSTEIRTYLGPMPPEGTGIHHYLYYIYHQSPPSGQLTGTVEDEEEIFHFNLEDYIERSAHQGVRLTGPLAGVQFRSKF